MYIRKIEIENIRGFEKLELDLTRPDGSLAGWTVAAGRNGSGKTTLLKAIAAVAVGKPSVFRLQSSEGWVRAGAERGSVALQIESSERDLRGPSGNRQRGRKDTETAKLTWASQDPRIWGDREPDNGVERQFAYKGDGWFIAGYGPFRRISAGGTGADHRWGAEPNIDRIITLFRYEVVLAESVTWLTHLYLKRLEEEKRTGNGTDGEAARLLTTVIELVNDGLLADGWKITDIDSDGLWMRRNGVELRVTELSEGNRAVAALVLDLAMQLHVAYGALELAGDGHGRPVVLHEGVVLIDEPEAHLHVSWQQDIGFWLKEHFPNIQFIVTTHSPFVCQAADPHGLIRLAASDSGRVSDDLYNTVVNGDVDDAVMSALFGLDQTHSPRAEALRNDVARLQAKVLRGQATPDEQAKLAELSARLPRTGTALVDQALRKLQATR